jgi:hypothetical protein
LDQDPQPDGGVGGLDTLGAAAVDAIFLPEMEGASLAPHQKKHGDRSQGRSEGGAPRGDHSSPLRFSVEERCVRELTSI